MSTANKLEDGQANARWTDKDHKMLRDAEREALNMPPTPIWNPPTLDPQGA